MSRLIDADALIRKYKTSSQMAIDGRARQIVEKMPTVEERKTGRWVYSDSDAERYDDIRCSVCGKHFTVDAERWCDIGFITSDLKYCPNCGARMEE